MPQLLHMLQADEGSRAASSSITLQQLDFAATMAAVLGVPTPFSNIGKVTPELYAVAAGMIQKANHTVARPCGGTSWLQSYLEALQSNSQQVRLNGQCHVKAEMVIEPWTDKHCLTSPRQAPGVDSVCSCCKLLGTCLQVHAYFSEYASHRAASLPSAELRRLNNLFSRASSAAQDVKADALEQASRQGLAAQLRLSASRHKLQ